MRIIQVQLDRGLTLGSDAIESDRRLDYEVGSASDTSRPAYAKGKMHRIKANNQNSTAKGSEVSNNLMSEG